MPYDEKLLERVRKVLASQVGITERRMFGGITFLVNGNMACGVETDRLMVRVGPEAHADALKRPHARPMDFTGTPLKGFVYVTPEGYRDARSLRRWVERGTAFARSLPPKPPRKARPARPRRPRRG